MAAKRTPATDVGRQAQSAARKANTREEVRRLTVRALRDRALTRDEISKVVHEVLEGASDAVKQSVPASRSSVLRQVFDGLSDAVGAVASAGVRTAHDAKERGRAIADNAIPAAARRIHAANDEFLRAISSFAKRASSELGEELDLLVKRARRTGGQAGTSARQAARAADGRLVELTGEAARAGVSVARRAAGELAMAASGLLEGLGEVVGPRKEPPRSGNPRRPAPKPRAKGKGRAGRA